MRLGLYPPLDELAGELRAPDAAANFLELAAFFAEDGFVRSSDVSNEVSIGADEESPGLDDEMRDGVEEIVAEVVQRIGARHAVLGSAYPFRLDPKGNILAYEPVGNSFGKGAYVLSLVLSNLHSPVLSNSRLIPRKEEIPRLRRLFQYLSTAALAAEVQGIAWSFDSPRPDGSSFLGKLKEIWSTFDDSTVVRQPGAPKHPKDDKVDVFAARIHPDQQPGFLLAAAQVAPGRNWKEKSRQDRSLRPEPGGRRLGRQLSRPRPGGGMRHRFHSICSYFAMFPESFVKARLAASPHEGVVFDPFCGRGTTVFQALLQGREAAGCDIHPVAVCVSGAKATPPSAAAARERVRDLRKLCREPDDPGWDGEIREFFELCYHPGTLSQIRYLRSVLNWRNCRKDRFIAALCLGALHGESHRSPNCFSNRMPRTISTGILDQVVAEEQP